MKITFNVLLSLLIQAKHTNGNNGNGRLLIHFLHNIADAKSERDLRNKFFEETTSGEAYHKIDRLILRFLPKGKGYPYDKISFENFEKNMNHSDRFGVYLSAMAKFCDDVLDTEKIKQLICILLDILRNDDAVDTLCYGGKTVSKSEFFGTVTNPKQVCIEALLVAFLYYVHKNPAEEIADGLKLLEVPNLEEYTIVRWDNNETNIETNIRTNPDYISRIIDENKLHIGKTIHEYISGFSYENQLEKFIVSYTMPLFARRMYKYEFGKFSPDNYISRSEIASFTKQAFEYFINDDNIFYNYIAPIGYSKKSLFDQWENRDVIEIILDTGLMKIAENEKYKLCFCDDIFREYFAVRCVKNLVEAFIAGYSESSVELQKSVYHSLGLDEQWFDYNMDENCKMLGEMIGDAQNIPTENDKEWEYTLGTYNTMNRFSGGGGQRKFEWYTRTFLDELLDIYRGFECEKDEFRITENVLNTMKNARNGLICNAIFDSLPLPYRIGAEIKFSRNGDFPSSFLYSRVNILHVVDSDFYLQRPYWACEVYIPENSDFTLILLRNKYVIQWDNVSEKVAAEMSLDECRERFGDIEFSDDEDLRASVEPLREKIYSQLNHFKGCDFYGAKFLESDYSEYLKFMGAVVD